MENIETILAGIEGLTPEQSEAIKAGVNANYRTIAEVQGKSAKLEDATKQLEALQSELAKAKELDGTNAEQLASFKAKVEELEKAQAEAAEAAKAKNARARFDEAFEKQMDGKAFVNAFTRDSIADKAFELRSANPDMGLDAIIEQVTAGQEGIWANPQRDPHKQPQGAQGGTPSITSADQLKGMSAAEINANWETIKEILKG